MKKLESLPLPVPLYHFKQPSRLNPRQLPFKLLRMKSLDQEGLLHVDVSESQARDSWFIGHTWQIVMCERCNGWKHIGWKFTPTTGGEIEAFYAVIVSAGKDEVVPTILLRLHTKYPYFSLIVSPLVGNTLGSLSTRLAL